MANAQELRLAVTQGDPERQARQRAAGKLTARERVERLCGGSLTLQSTPGEGTTVTIRIPKNEEHV